MGSLEKVIGHKDDPLIDVLAVAYDNGFYLEDSIEVKKQLETIPTEVKQEEIKKGTEYYTKSTKGPVNIRKTSSKNSPLQDELPDGVVLKFIGKEGKWYRVSYTVNNQTKEGFVHVSQIKKK